MLLRNQLLEQAFLPPNFNLEANAMALVEPNSRDEYRASTEGSALADIEKAATAALDKAEAFVRENPMAAVIGVGAAGALLALAISRRNANQPIDRRLLNELNRHSEDIVRAVRRNANAVANSDTASALESFVTNLLTNISKVPSAVSNQVSNLTK